MFAPLPWSARARLRAPIRRPALGLLRAPLLAPLGLGFTAAARARRARALHPRGVVLGGTLNLTGASTGVPFLDRAVTVPVVARLSKATSTPGRLPDVLGLAVRVPDAGGPGRPLDLVLSSVGSAGATRYLPLPAVRWQTTYGSILRYDVAGRRALALATVVAPPAPLASSLAALQQAGQLVAHLRLESPAGTVPLGTVELVGPPDPDQLTLRFDHDNLVPGLRARGLLAALSRAAYAGSRRGAPAGPGPSGPG